MVQLSDTIMFAVVASTLAVVVLAFAGVDFVHLFAVTPVDISNEVTCVKASCCHATSCVPESESPDCTGLFCTLDVEPWDNAICRYNTKVDECVLTPDTCGDGICQTSVSSNSGTINKTRENNFGDSIPETIKNVGSDWETGINCPEDCAVPECSVGDIQTKVCSDNTTIITHTCDKYTLQWSDTGNTCPKCEETVDTCLSLNNENITYQTCSCVNETQYCTGIMPSECRCDVEGETMPVDVTCGNFLECDMGTWIEKIVVCPTTCENGNIKYNIDECGSYELV